MMPVAHARARLSRRELPLVALCLVVLVVLVVVAMPMRAQQTVQRDVTTSPNGAPSTQPVLPPLSPDAQRLLDQLKQTQDSIIEQLRWLQLAYRDAGRAEDAAAIAANVRLLQRRNPPVSGGATAELVNDGLATRDEPVRMSLFRNRVGDTLSFAIRGRDDQSVWGTTTYTDDSALESAAVHAGILRAGQAAIVKVRVLPGLERYDASKQNNIDSGAYGHSEGSYRFIAAAVTTPNRTSSLSSYRDLVGTSVTLPVVGSVSGSVWGSDIYTDDSSLAAAAVHAGVVNPGEFAFVKVTLLPGQPHYDGFARNGVTSQAYDGFDGSFRVEPAPQPWTVQLPGDEDASRLVPMTTLRGHTDVSFVVQVVGSTTGQVWGSGTYTDDSSIAAAAVHAGLLKPGETGFLRVTIAAGRDSYPASERNGVKSQQFGTYPGSFRLERVAK